MTQSLTKSWDIGMRAASLFCLLAILFNDAHAQNQGGETPAQRPETLRSDVVLDLTLRSEGARARAQRWAREQGMPLYTHLWHGQGMKLMDVQGNRPVYFSTFNHNAAIGSGAASLFETLEFDLDGTGFTVGLWDQNMPLDTHQEFQLSGSRITLLDQGDLSEHATNVAGTLGAVGVNRNAMGMAPGVMIDARDWDNDLSEMAAAAASVPNEPGMIYVSNHSYGVAGGWTYSNLSGSFGWHWMAEWEGGDSIEPAFGQYGQRTAILDALAWDSPYFLAFIAAGNDRSDNPNQGANVYYPTYPNGNLVWRKKRFDSQCPAGDGHVDQGYDTLTSGASAKNVVAVGAVTLAVQRGVRDFSDTEVSSYSSYGPADDGRVKPDLMAQGDSLNTAASDTDRAYARVSGTSFSCPSASGSAILLVQYYDRLFEGQAMRASTLKGLLLHTADDLARPGPDYQTGWGLINVEAAAQLMRRHSEIPLTEGSMLIESRLDETLAVQTHDVTLADPQGVTFTLCWTDPEAFPTARHDRRSPSLVHDLDLRVFKGNQTYLPYTLDPLEPEENAVPGDNVVDNVEQIVLNTSEPGAYRIEVSRKRTLTTPVQWYSLICDVPVIKISRHPSR